MKNKIKDIPDGTEVWVKMRREKGYSDDYDSIRFDIVGKDGDYAYLDDENEVLTEEEMRERFSVNDGMPKQGEMIEVRAPKWSSSWKKEIFVCMYEGQAITHCGDKDFCAWDEWRYPEKETVTLKDGKTYFVEERDGEKILKLKN